MIKTEAKQAADKIYSDVVGLEVTNVKSERKRIAVLIADSILEVTHDALWQYVVNELRER